MDNFWIVSDAKGVGKLLLSKYMQKPDDLSGHSVYFNNHRFTIGKDNIITIPAEIMKEAGLTRKDGRHVVGVQISFRHVDKKKVVGLGLHRGKHITDYIEDAVDGKPLPKAAALDDPANSEVLVPADIKEFTQSDGVDE